MLYVDIPTSADLTELATARAPGSVSIYLPTTPVNGEISNARIELKNMAREAHDQLVASGADKHDLAAIAEHLADLGDDEDFWRFQANSVAIFATPVGVRTFRLPNALSPLTEIADGLWIVDAVLPSLPIGRRMTLWGTADGGHGAVVTEAARAALIRAADGLHR